MTRALIAIGLLLTVSAFFAQGQDRTREPLFMREYDLSFLNTSAVYQHGKHRLEYLRTERMDQGGPRIVIGEGGPELGRAWAEADWYDGLSWLFGDQLWPRMQDKSAGRGRVAILATESGHGVIARIVRAMRAFMLTRVHLQLWRVSHGRELVGTAHGAPNETLVFGSVHSTPFHDSATRYYDRADSAHTSTIYSGREFALTVSRAAGGRLVLHGRASEQGFEQMRQVPTQSGITLHLPIFTQRFVPVMHVLDGGGTASFSAFGDRYVCTVNIHGADSAIDVDDAGLVLADLSTGLLSAASTNWALTGFEYERFTAGPVESLSGTAHNAASRFRDESRELAIVAGARTAVLGPIFAALRESPDVHARSRLAWDALRENAARWRSPTFGRFVVTLREESVEGESQPRGEVEFTLATAQESDWYDLRQTVFVPNYVIPVLWHPASRMAHVDTTAFGVQLRLGWDGNSIGLRAGVRDPAGPVEQFNTGVMDPHDLVIERQAAHSAELHTTDVLAVGQSTRAFAPYRDGVLVAEVRRVE